MSVRNPHRARLSSAVVSTALLSVALAVVPTAVSAAEPRVLAPNGCTRTVTGALGGVQTVGAGEKLCLRAATVDSAINVTAGGALLSEASTITGAITLTGAAGLTVCSSTVIGAISATGGSGALSIGDNGACGGSLIDGEVTLSGNQGAVRLAGSTVTGAVTVTDNATGASAGPRIGANHIGGALSCAGNLPAPTNTGRPNVVVGPRSGQCIAVRF